MPVVCSTEGHFPVRFSLSAQNVVVVVVMVDSICVKNGNGFGKDVNECGVFCENRSLNRETTCLTMSNSVNVEPL